MDELKLENVEEIFEKEVSRFGRIEGLTKYQGRIAKVIFREGK